jgi:hypothetical protein
MPHKAFIFADIETTKEKIQKNLNDNDIRCVVLDSEYEPSTGYTNYTVLVDDRSFEKYYDTFREPDDRRTNFIERLEVKLNLKPMLMTWFNEEEPFFCMNVWLHEKSGIAFVDKNGTIRIYDLDIDIPAYETEQETFEPRKV